MKPSKINGRSAIVPSHSSSKTTWHDIRGGDQSSTSLYQESSLIQRRGGGASTRTTQQQQDDYEYVDDEDDDGYYYADDDDDGEEEYEYYDEGGANNNDDDDGYYYADDDEDEGYIYLPDTDDDEVVEISSTKKQRTFLHPLKSRATKSLSKINGATTLPVLNLSKTILSKASVPLSSLSTNLGKLLPNGMSSSVSNISNRLQELNIINGSSSVMVLSVVILAVAARSIIVLNNNNTRFKKNGKKKKKRRKNDRGRNKKSKLKGSPIWKTRGKRAKDETTNEDKKEDVEYYSDYSKGYPGAASEEDDEDTMDLDLEDDNVKKSSKKKTQRWRGLPTPRLSLTRVLVVPSLASDVVQNL